jgi:hypothetical protein
VSEHKEIKPTHPTILLLACGVMEVTWLSAWAIFVMFSLTQRLFPLPTAIVAFSIAAALTFFIRGRGWRWITIIGLHLLICLPVTLYIIYAFNYWSYPFWSRTWTDALFNTPDGHLKWLILSLTLFWALLFWMGGIQFTRWSNTYRNVCRRFDLGLGMLLGLFLIKLMVLIRDGVPLVDPLTKWLILPFLLFGMIAIGSARNRNHTPKTYRAGYRLIGVVLSFAVVVIMSGVGLLAFFWTYFTMTAETGYDLLKQGFQPFVPMLRAVLLFWFMPHGGGVAPVDTRRDINVGNVNLSPGEMNWWTALLEKILNSSIGGILGILLVVVLGIGIWHFIRWSLSKTPRSKQKHLYLKRLLAFLLQITVFFQSCIALILSRLRGYSTATQFYRLLIVWGRRSGLPHRSSETPWEYGSRLSRYFPAIYQEIMLVVELFQQEVYNENPLNAQQITQASQALHQLRSPIHWWSRFRIWLREGKDEAFRTSVV